MSVDIQSKESDVYSVEKQKESSNVVNIQNGNLSNFYQEENDDIILASSTFEMIRDGSCTFKELTETACKEFQVNEIEAETKVLRLITEWNKIKGLLVANISKRKRNVESDGQGGENQHQSKRRRIEVSSGGKKKDSGYSNSIHSRNNLGSSNSSDGSNSSDSNDGLGNSTNTNNISDNLSMSATRRGGGGSEDNLIHGISSRSESIPNISSVGSFSSRLNSELLDRLIFKAAHMTPDRLDEKRQYRKDVKGEKKLEDIPVCQIDDEDDEMLDHEDRENKEEMMDDYEMDEVLVQSESMSMSERLARMVLLRELEGISNRIHKLELWDPSAFILERGERVKLVREIDSEVTGIPLPGRLEPPTRNRGRQQWARDNLLFKVMNDLRVVLKGLIRSIVLMLDGKGEEAVVTSAKVIVLIANALSLLNAERMQIHYPRELVRTMIKPRTEPILRDEYRERARQEAQERRDTGVVMRSFFPQGGRSFKDTNSRDIRKPGRQFRNSFPHFSTTNRWKFNKSRFQNSRFQSSRSQTTNVKQQKSQQ
jgi:hypothetical protein